MSRDLQSEVLSRLAQRSEASIQKQAEAAFSSEQAVLAHVNDEALICERALQLGRLIRLREQRGGQLNRGLRRFRRSSHRLDMKTFTHKRWEDMPAEPVFISRKKKIKSFRIVESGVRTPLFGLDTPIFRDGYVLDSGWEAGQVTHRSVSNATPTKAQLLKPVKAPLLIWRATKERESAEVARELWYEVIPGTGMVTSYTEGKRDDEQRMVGKQAGAHALSLLNTAIELFET